MKQVHNGSRRKFVFMSTIQGSRDGSVAVNNYSTVPSSSQRWSKAAFTRCIQSGSDFKAW